MLLSVHLLSLTLFSGSPSGIPAGLSMYLHRLSFPVSTLFLVQLAFSSLSVVYIFSVPLLCTQLCSSCTACSFDSPSIPLFVDFHLDALYNSTVYMCTTLLDATSRLPYQSVHVTTRTAAPYFDTRPTRQTQNTGLGRKKHSMFSRNPPRDQPRDPSRDLPRNSSRVPHVIHHMCVQYRLCGINVRYICV